MRRTTHDQAMTLPHHRPDRPKRWLVLPLLAGLFVPPCPAEEPHAQQEALRDLMEAEIGWQRALDEALRHDDPKVVLAAAAKVMSQPPGPPHRRMLRMMTDPAAPARPAPPSLPATLVERLLNPRCTGETARQVQSACHAALIELRHVPDHETLLAIERELGRPAALLLACLVPHKRREFLAKAIDAPDPIDIVHLEAWNRLRIHDESALIRSCWNGLRVELRIMIWEAKEGIGVYAAGEYRNDTQTIGNLLLKTRARDGDTVFGDHDLAVVPVWLRHADRHQHPSAGTAMSLRAARSLYVQRCAAINPAVRPEDGPLAEATAIDQRIDLFTADVDDAKKRADETVIGIVSAWEAVRARLASFGQVAVDRRHPPVRVRIISDERGPVAEWTVEASHPAAPGEASQAP